RTRDERAQRRRAVHAILGTGDVRRAVRAGIRAVENDPLRIDLRADLHIEGPLAVQIVHLVGVAVDLVLDWRAAAREIQDARFGRCEFYRQRTLGHAGCRAVGAAEALAARKRAELCAELRRRGVERTSSDEPRRRA